MRRKKDNIREEEKGIRTEKEGQEGNWRLQRMKENKYVKCEEKLYLKSGGIEILRKMEKKLEEDVLQQGQYL